MQCGSFRHAIFGVASMTLAAVSAVPANATAVTVGTIYQEGSERHSTRVPTVSNCINVITCFIIFNIVPSGKQLLITDVSCRMNISAPTAALILGEIVTFTGAGQKTDRSHALLPTLLFEVSQSNKAYALKDTTRHVVKAGERPVIELSVLNGASVRALCGITGKVGNPPE